MAQFMVLGRALEGELWSDARGKELWKKIDTLSMGFISESDFIAFVRDGKQFLELEPAQFDSLCTRLLEAVKEVTHQEVKDAQALAASLKKLPDQQFATDEEARNAELKRINEDAEKALK